MNHKRLNAISHGPSVESYYKWSEGFNGCPREKKLENKSQYESFYTEKFTFQQVLYNFLNEVYFIAESSILKPRLVWPAITNVRDDRLHITVDF